MVTKDEGSDSHCDLGIEGASGLLFWVVLCEALNHSFHLLTTEPSLFS